MLKSLEVLNGNFSSSRRFSSGHTGIDFVCPKGTPYKSRYAGKITEVKKNPKGVDWGLFIRTLYDNSKVIGAGAHLSKAIVKVGQKVKKGQVIGYTGNTGYTISGGVVCNEKEGCGNHLHYSEHTTGKLVWLNPDKTNVKEKEVEDMYTDKSGIFKDSKGNPITLSAAAWNASAVRYYKDFGTTRAKLASVNTIVSQQATQLKTLAGQIVELQNDVTSLTKEKQGFLEMIADQEGKIDILTAQIKALQEANGSLTGYSVGELLLAVWSKIKDIKIG